MTSESTILTGKILKRHGARPDLRLFRNETAGSWVGKLGGRRGKSVTLNYASFVRAGLAPGSSDLIGILYPGRFVALEVKTGTDRMSQSQKAFIRTIRLMGGIAGEVRSVEDVDALIGPPPPPDWTPSPELSEVWGAEG